MIHADEVGLGPTPRPVNLLRINLGNYIGYSNSFLNCLTVDSMGVE
jgi:hypothetical protein